MSTNQFNLNSNGSASSSNFDHLLIQSLMSRLQLRPPYLDTNSFLSQNLDDFILPSSASDSDSDDLSVDAGDADSRHRKLVSREESRLEKEIIKIIEAGDGDQTLKPNSGQSVSIGDHSVCVGVHEERGSEYRVWEWHGHIMFFDDEDGYSTEYIYGNYFERLSDKKLRKKQEEEEEDVEEEEGDGSKVKGEGNSGLRDLIEDVKGATGDGVARVVHRNSLNAK